MTGQTKQRTENQGTFQGFPPEFFAFYEGLEKDNSKDYWNARKDDWEQYVREPTQQIMAELEPRFGQLRSFRPQQDTRFTADKSPYKLWTAVTSTPQAVGGVGYFVRIEASGLRAAAGAMVLASDQVDRFRTAVVNDMSGAEFTDIAAELAARDLPVSSGRAPELKRVPSGYPADHPRAEYLRWKGAVVIREYHRAGWMHTREALDRVREVWEAAEPLKQWIDRYVGASRKPTPQRGFPRRAG